MVTLENDSILQNTLMFFADNSLKDIISFSEQRKNYEHTNSDEKLRMDTALKYQNYAKAQIEAGKISIDKITKPILLGMLISYEIFLKTQIANRKDLEFNEKKLKSIPGTRNRVNNTILI